MQPAILFNTCDDDGDDYEDDKFNMIGIIVNEIVSL